MWRAEDAGRSECRSVMGRIEVILTAKAGRLPVGHQSRETMQNHRMGESQMSEAQASCAPPNPDADAWDHIPWGECATRVRRLQERIVKATREGRLGKVKSLQWLLTHSHYGKALAVNRVTRIRVRILRGLTAQSGEPRRRNTERLERYVGTTTDRNHCEGSTSLKAMGSFDRWESPR